QSLSFDYDDKPLLQGVHFSLAAGQLLHLRGDNGSGKTTLLKLLAGILSPRRGSLMWDQQNVHDNMAAYQRNLCYVGHKPGLSPQLTVRENCLYDLHWSRSKHDLNTLLTQFSLNDMADTPCYQLSAGQQRRVALLRLAMTDARLWLLDEPLVALDHDAIQGLTTCLQAHLAEGGIIIMTSHQPLPDSLQQHEEYSLS
ncbi:MAG: cytochrome c biogenesis heme-transporting ATPase CcmA, partial [Prosthecobacter sp.]|nr:cytochrome c biogenesis heme-transporting ATPase CcmA [Prosthecobacter sp.]